MSKQQKTVRKRPIEDVRERPIEEVRKKPTEETQQYEAVKRQRVDKNEKTLERILRQTATLLAKVDKVISYQEEIRERLLNLEKNNNNDDKGVNKDFVKKIVKESARRLLDKSIYPNQDELFEATNSYIKEEHPSFFSQFKRGVDGTQWKVYYEKNVASELLKKHRSLRGSLVSKIREVLFSVFRRIHLPPINTNVTESEYRSWKNSSIVKNCYKSLFKKIDSEDSETYMSRIIRNVLKGRNTKAPKIQIAFAVSVCEFVLNPSNLTILISEEAIKPILEKNLKKIAKRENLFDEADCYESSGSASSGVVSTDIKKDGEYDEEGGKSEYDDEGGKGKYDDEGGKSEYDGEGGKKDDEVVLYTDSDDENEEFSAEFEKAKEKYKKK